MSSSKLGSWPFPERASTQAWMVLTFALFVGSAVAVVGLYVTFVVRGQMDRAMEETLREQGEQIVVQLEQASTPDARATMVRELAELTPLRISVETADTLYGNAAQDTTLMQAALLDRTALGDASSRVVEFGERTTDDASIYYMALYRPESGLLLRLGQPEPPLYRLVERMEMVLVGGMLLALVFALIGSWVAAYQVVTPLKTIRNSAKRVSEGRFAGKIRVDSRAAEFQDLAESLNRASARFREKIDDLERLTRLQSEFIGNVGHEVRNPIFAISGYLEALGSPTLPDAQRKRYAEKGLTNLQRLSNLFDDLIEMARLEYREDLIKESVFDLQELVDEVVDMLRPKARKKDLHLEVDNPQLMIRADRARIRQVLVNLVDNAIAYTDDGTVRCRFRRRLDKVRIEVVDTGKGIEENHLSRIFERFYRVDPDRSRASGGTGLGLSIVKQILQAHGEKIHVESTKGRGTRFWFELPFAGAPEPVESA